MNNRDLRPRPVGQNPRLNPGLRRINYRIEMGSGPVPVEEVERTLEIISPQEEKSDTSDESPSPQLPELNQDDIQAFYQQSLERSTANRSDTPSNRGLWFDDSSSDDGDLSADGRRTRNTVFDTENAMLGRTPHHSPATSQIMLDAALVDYGSRTGSDDLQMANRSSDLTVSAINLSGSDTSKTSGQKGSGSDELRTESNQELSGSDSVLGSQESSAPSSIAVSRAELAVIDSVTNIEEARTNTKAASTGIRTTIRKTVRRMLSRLIRPFRACFRPKTQD